MGSLAIGGSGEIVDWLVEMRRLDRSRMLDVMLAQGRATVDRPAARRAAAGAVLCAGAAAVTDGAALAARLDTQVQANHRVLEGLDAPLARGLRDAQRAFVGNRRDWLDARAAGGCVVEAHGDLRAEHIVLLDPPAVIDCLEFDRSLRVLDRAEELEFLEIECARIGHGAGRADDRLPVPRRAGRCRAGTAAAVLSQSPRRDACQALRVAGDRARRWRRGALACDGRHLPRRRDAGGDNALA